MADQYELYEELKKEFKEIRKGNISEIERKRLYKMVNGLENRTDKQKRRFILYYGLDTNENKQLTFKEIGNIEKCSPDAARSSVVRVSSEVFAIEYWRRKNKKHK